MKPPKVTKRLAVSNFKTRWKVVVFWILVMGLLYVSWFAINMFPVVSGYGAKNLCSCVFVQGRDEQEVINQELGTILGSLGTFAVDRSDSSASGRVLFLARKKAIYRKGLGCTLVNGLEEQELRAQKFTGKPDAIPVADSIAWPDGDRVIETDSTPAGLNREKLNEVVADHFIEKNPEALIKTRAVIVVYDGQLVAEQYAPGFNAQTPQMGWSMAKSITNAMVGILVKQGKLNVDAPAPIEAWKYDDRSKITINDLLRASSGLEWTEIYSRPSDATEMLFRTKDNALYATSKKGKYAPNEKFYYSSGATLILQGIMRQTLGDEAYHQLPYEKLFNKIGMTSALLEVDPAGTFVGSSFDYATARDWARFGLLYQNDGVWNGERILPEGWVKYTTTPAPAAERGEYGAQWWLNAGAKDNPANKVYPDLPNDTYWADGFEGQTVMIIPSKKLVVVRLGLSQEAEPDLNKFVADIISTISQ
jgi:CubicO group peptidase (beta-lactamase class C family)